MDEVYATLCSGLQQAHKDLVGKRKKNEKDTAMHGALSETKQLETEQSEKLFERLLVRIEVLVCGLSSHT